MSTVSQGSSGFGSLEYQLVEQGWANDQTGRQTWTQTFKGTQTGIEALRLTFAGGSIPATVRFVPGGESTLTAIWPYEPEGSETPVDEWAYEEVATQPSIWTHPEVAPELIADPGARASIISAIESGNSSPPYTPSTVLGNVYLRLLRGTDSWEANKPMIHRVRSFSGDYGSPATLTLTTTVYSRTSLISTFSVPSAFQPRIPANPSWTAPDETTWGWRKGPQISTFNPATRRWEERFSFEGGFWDDALYTHV